MKPRRRLVALAGAWLLAGAAAAANVPVVGQPVALPALPLANGGTLASAALRGKTVVFAWFASYCPYCMQEAPKLQRLYAANAGRLLVVGVNVERGDAGQAAKVGQWVAKYGWTFPVVLDGAALERALGKPKGIPALVVVDRRGIVRQVESGELLDEDFDDIAAAARRDAP
jgi:thiol-disulfide isomerase/thioredoxin